MLVCPPGVLALPALLSICICASSGCDPAPLPGDEGTTTGPSGGSEATGDGTSTGPEGSSSAGGESSSSSGEPVDPELDAIANLRRDLADGYTGECLDLRKLGATATDPGVVVLVDLPPSNGAMPGEDTAVRTYTLPDDAERLKLRAFAGVAAPGNHPCDSDVPPQGTELAATAGTFTVTWEVVDDGCLFTCERLFIEIADLVLERGSDGATVDVGELYLPAWTDPAPPM